MRTKVEKILHSETWAGTLAGKTTNTPTKEKTHGTPPTRPPGPQFRL